MAQGSILRYAVTDLEGDSQTLYEQVYCARGDMENRIKEQLDLFANRTSCSLWWPNQFRLKPRLRGTRKKDATQVGPSSAGSVCR